MNLGEARKALRTLVDDRSVDPLWDDDEIDFAINEAHREAADRAWLIEDYTSAMCLIDVVAGTHTYDLDPRILSIKRAKLDAQINPLTQTSVEMLDNDSAGWETRSSNTPQRFLDELSSIRLVPAPLSDDILRLRVYRLPLVDLNDDLDELEIPLPKQYGMLNWAARCLYLKQDVDTRDEQRAKQFEILFDAEFGPRADARARREFRDARPRVVSFREF